MQAPLPKKNSIPNKQQAIREPSQLPTQKYENKLESQYFIDRKNVEPFFVEQNVVWIYSPMYINVS